MVHLDSDSKAGAYSIFMSCFILVVRRFLSDPRSTYSFALPISPLSYFSDAENSPPRVWTIVFSDDKDELARESNHRQ